MENKINLKIKTSIIFIICTLIFLFGSVKFFNVKAAETLDVSDKWITIASMNEAKYYSNSVVLNGKIYVIGGYNRKQPFSSMEVYDPATDTWTKMASMNEARHHHISVVVNNKIYVIGGSNGIKSLESAEVYDPETNTWTMLPTMNQARYESNLAVVDGKIYVIGGSGTNGSVEVYDPTRNTWKVVASMKEARDSFTSAVLNGKIYIMGGYKGGGLLSSSIEVYDPAVNNWTTVTSMNGGRAFHNSVVMNGKIYVIGGADLKGYLSSVEVYDPVINTWTTLASMNIARLDFTSVTVNNRIYAMGGAGIPSSVEVYDVVSNTWMKLADMNTERIGHNSVALNNKLFAIGGYNGGSILSSVEVYSISKMVIEKNYDSLKVGQTDIITAKTTPAGIAITWTSSDPSIATVDSNGKVTAVKPGTVSITARAVDGSNLSATCQITVKPETIINLSKTSMSIIIGQTDTLSATVTPSDILVNWSSNDSNIAAVDSSGVITAIGTGTTTITATTSDGKTANCEVVVTPEKTIEYRGKLTLVMPYNDLKIYDLSKDEVDSFLTWYEGRSNGVGKSYYIFQNKSKNSIIISKDYIPYNKISYFNIEEYEVS
ncbi:kelch repeat-containing protein [Clostridium cellulovorans]|uniref:Kelch repeat type 1-containing protein n=1 Tax=Clostridium cellulovorans (strain ATCC 35296 / DSM 3052 / OCM 3 / 743B) TaxID=573061 RepID=D9SQW2_CLOC7|nr:kelch repeat-containing protein [Clostridium cellulovorans]ADL52318.1 Kelch repeat type 1-containing protein [Clostridium cellulovorans 743B]